MHSSSYSKLQQHMDGGDSGDSGETSGISKRNQRGGKLSGYINGRMKKRRQTDRFGYYNDNHYTRVPMWENDSNNDDDDDEEEEEEIFKMKELRGHKKDEADGSSKNTPSLIMGDVIEGGRWGTLYMLWCRIFHFEYFLSTLGRLCITTHQVLNLASIGSLMFVLSYIGDHHFFDMDNKYMWHIDSLFMMILVLTMIGRLVQFVAWAYNPESCYPWVVEIVFKVVHIPLSMFTTMALIKYRDNVQVKHDAFWTIISVLFLAIAYMTMGEVFFRRLYSDNKFKGLEYGPCCELKRNINWGFNVFLFGKIVRQSYVARLICWVYTIIRLGNGVGVKQNNFRKIPTRKMDRCYPLVNIIKSKMCSHCQDVFMLVDSRSAAATESGAAGIEQCTCDDSTLPEYDVYVRMELRRNNGNITGDICKRYAHDRFGITKDVKEIFNNDINLQKLTGRSDPMLKMLNQPAAAALAAVRIQEEVNHYNDGLIQHIGSEQANNLIKRKQKLKLMDNGTKQLMQSIGEEDVDFSNHTAALSEQNLKTTTNTNNTSNNEEWDYDYDDDDDEIGGEEAREGREETDDQMQKRLCKMTEEQLQKELAKAIKVDIISTESDTTTSTGTKDLKDTKNKLVAGDASKPELIKLILDEKQKLSGDTTSTTDFEPVICPRRNMPRQVKKRAGIVHQLVEHTIDSADGVESKYNTETGMSDCCWHSGTDTCHCYTKPYLSHRHELANHYISPIQSGLVMFKQRLAVDRIDIKETVNALPHSVIFPEDLYAISKKHINWKSNAILFMCFSSIYVFLFHYLLLPTHWAVALTYFTASIGFFYDIYFFWLNGCKLKTSFFMHGVVQRVLFEMFLYISIYYINNLYENILGI